MTRLSRIIVCAALLELIAAAIYLPLARWPAIAEALSGDGALQRLNAVRLAITFAGPIVLLMTWLLFERRLASPSRPISLAHNGYAEAGLVTVAFFLMAYQGWFASHLGLGHESHASREQMLRVGAIFAGMLMAIQGNFSAKTPAHEGVDVPDRRTWTRAKLRTGWVMALAGLAIALCAIVLPLPQLLPVFLLLGIATASYVVLQQRRLA